MFRISILEVLGISQARRNSDLQFFLPNTDDNCSLCDPSSDCVEVLKSQAIFFVYTPWVVQHKINNVLCNPRGVHKKVFRLCTIVVGSRVQALLKVTFYRPQQSCDKVMFLHLSVILFTGGGGSLSGGLCPGGSLSGRSLSRGGLCPGDPPCHHTVTCGWYTSYWNAFLLLYFFALIQSGRSDRMVYLRKNSILDS